MEKVVWRCSSGVFVCRRLVDLGKRFQMACIPKVAIDAAKNGPSEVWRSGGEEGLCNTNKEICAGRSGPVPGVALQEISRILAADECYFLHPEGLCCDEFYSSPDELYSSPGHPIFDLKLWTARSRLYQNLFWRPNTRWKALILLGTWIICAKLNRRF